MKQPGAKTMGRVKQICQRGKDYILIAWSPSATFQSIATLLAVASPDEQAILISRFVISKQNELSNLIVGSALVASLSAGLLSWSWFPTPPYTAKVCLLCALLHSLVGLGVATQQTLAFSRVDIHPRRTEIIRDVMWATKKTPTTTSTSFDTDTSGFFWRAFAWQVPTTLLGNSIMFVVAALCIAVYSQAAKAVAGGGPEIATAICFTISLCFSGGCYLISWFNVESEIQKAVQADEASLPR